MFGARDFNILDIDEARPLMLVRCLPEKRLGTQVTQALQ
jgi:hypothetical protein